MINNLYRTQYEDTNFKSNQDGHSWSGKDWKRGLRTKIIYSHHVSFNCDVLTVGCSTSWNSFIIYPLYYTFKTRITILENIIIS